MAFSDYLHEKAEESRHDETLAYLMFLAGAVFSVGGLLATLSLPDGPEWFLIFPYYSVPSAGMFLSLAMLIGGVSLIIYGIVAGMHYSGDRSWYLKELQKANSLQDSLMLEKSRKKNGRKKKSGKE